LRSAPAAVFGEPHSAAIHHCLRSCARRGRWIRVHMEPSPPSLAIRHLSVPVCAPHGSVRRINMQSTLEQLDPVLKAAFPCSRVYHSGGGQYNYLRTRHSWFAANTWLRTARRPKDAGVERYLDEPSERHHPPRYPAGDAQPSRDTQVRCRRSGPSATRRRIFRRPGQSTIVVRLPRDNVQRRRFRSHYFGLPARYASAGMTRMWTSMRRCASNQLIPLSQNGTAGVEDVGMSRFFNSRIGIGSMRPKRLFAGTGANLYVRTPSE